MVSMDEQAKKYFRIFIILYFIFLVIAFAIMAVGVWLFDARSGKQATENRELITGLRQGAESLEKSLVDLNGRFDIIQAAVGNLEKSIATNTKRVVDLAGGNAKSIAANQEIIQQLTNIQNAFQSLTSEMAASENIGESIRKETAAIREQLKNGLDNNN